MNEYKLINENVKTINSLTVDKHYTVIDINNGLTSFYNDDNELVALPNTWFEGITDEKPKGGRLRNPDADPLNELTVEYNPNNDEVSPCHQCNI